GSTSAAKPPSRWVPPAAPGGGSTNATSPSTARGLSAASPTTDALSAWQPSTTSRWPAPRSATGDESIPVGWVERGAKPIICCGCDGFALLNPSYCSTVLLGRSVPAKHDSRCQISPELRPNRPRALWSSLRGRGSRAALVAVGFDLVQRDRGFERRARARIRSAWPFYVAPRKRRESG